MFFNLTNSQQPDVDIVYHYPCCDKYRLPNYNGLSYVAVHDCNSKCFKIETVRCFKYLGVILDSKMSWHDHTQSLKCYFRSVVRQFYVISPLCSSSVLKTFYFGIFHSKLNYGITCWGGSYSNKIKPLLTLQKSVVRKIHHANNLSHSFEFFKSSNILPVRHLYYFQVMKRFFSNSNFQRTRTTVYNLRNHNVINVPYFRTTGYRNSFNVVCRRLFNRLPGHLQSCERKGLFLNQLKKWLLNYNFDEIESLLRPVA